ncbi:MAG TPA: ParB/RepB/Spo0J family partition protein, partial [Tepidisphaeraceae bacterium]|nr:ParB/RepB/Spo0J family partition protein [Tepidisphaeraceae bacterium]
MSSQKPRNRLGRGLSSLMGMPEDAPQSIPVQTEISEKSTPASIDRDENSLEIPIEKITPNPHQPRRSFDDSSLSDLANSIKSNGLIQPIIVRKIASGYQLIAGERRLRASKLAGLLTIHAIVRDVDKLTQAQMALVENIQREDLNAI